MTRRHLILVATAAVACGLVVVAGWSLLGWSFVTGYAPVSDVPRAEVVGEWTVVAEGGESLTIVFDEDGAFRASDWLSQVGCEEQTTTLTVSSIDWSRRTPLFGTWAVVPGSQGTQVSLLADSASPCGYSPALWVDRRPVSGEYALSLFIAGLGADDEYLRLLKSVLEGRQ